MARLWAYGHIESISKLSLISVPVSPCLSRLLCIAICLVCLVSQALALFGFGEDPVVAYTAQTTAVIEQVRMTLELGADDEGKAAAIEKTRNLTNAWVARYRRDKVITGKPSYGNVYSALNAVSGHYNNFGTKYPLPQKRKDRVLSEFATAEIALSRGR